MNKNGVMNHEAVLDCGDENGGRPFCERIREGESVTSKFKVTAYGDSDGCCYHPATLRKTATRAVKKS